MYIFLSTNYESKLLRVNFYCWQSVYKHWLDKLHCHMTALLSDAPHSENTIKNFIV